ERKCNANDCAFHHEKSTSTLLRRHSAEKNAEATKNTQQSQSMKTTRCVLFPLCFKTFQECEYIHPYLECRHFSQGCRLGRNCRFKHPYCAKDGECVNEECEFMHQKQVHPHVAAVIYAHE
ncbi:hypothetical protein PFISCL1PPCAC_1405, partial [Pristionchus fissidentatus]